MFCAIGNKALGGLSCVCVCSPKTCSDWLHVHSGVGCVGHSDINCEMPVVLKLRITLFAAKSFVACKVSYLPQILPSWVKTSDAFQGSCHAVCAMCDACVLQVAKPRVSDPFSCSRVG